MEIVEIHIREQIAADWADWFGGMSVLPAGNGQTVLRGEVRDQAALQGILAVLAGLNLELARVVSEKVQTYGDATRKEVRVT